MPLGRPASDGTLQASSRHYRGGQGLGVLHTWNCPACGVLNEGSLAQGCAACGAGDERQGTAGTGQIERRAEGEALTEPLGTVLKSRSSVTSVPRHGVESVPPHTIYRLIEYVVNPGKDVTLTLRNSLVGRLTMDWGTLTGTIIDSLDAQQEDRLRMARMQPGVWMGNTEVMRHDQTRVREAATDRALVYSAQDYQQVQDAKMTTSPYRLIEYVVAERAEQVVALLGLRVAHTLALALSGIAEELAQNSEPEKFLSRDECLGLAQALMNLIPEDWNPQPPEEESPHADHPG